MTAGIMVASSASTTAATPAIMASVEKPTGMDLRLTKDKKPFAEPIHLAIYQPMNGPMASAIPPSSKPSSK
ncbi:hypothetical protein D3C80_1999620 [compost metagenome]